MKSTLGPNIDENCEALAELLRSIPVASRGRAKAAAIKVENAIQSLKRDYPNDPAATLGFVFAIMLTAQRLVENENEKSGQDAPLIQLLS